MFFDLSLNQNPAPLTHNIDILFFNKGNSSLFNFLKVEGPTDTNLAANFNNDLINITSLTKDSDFKNKYYNYLNIGLQFLSNHLYLHNGNNSEGIKVYNFDFALNGYNNNQLSFINSGTANFSLSDNEIENNMGISNTQSQSQSVNNGLDSGLYIHDVANSNIDSNNVGNNSNNVYNYPNQLNVEFENSLSKLLNNKRLSQINGYDHIRDHYVDGYIADGDERLITDSRINSLNRINENEKIIDNQLNNSNNNNNPNNNNNTQKINGNKHVNNMLINGRMIDEINTNNDLWLESMNSKDNPIVNRNNMNNINDLLRSNCSNTLNNNNCLNQNINDCGSDINESCKNNYCCSKINCRENGTDKNNRELKHIHEHSHKKNNEYKGEEDNNNEIDDENSDSGNGDSKNSGSKNGGSGNGGSGNGGGGVFNNGRVGYNKNKTGNLDSNYQVNNNNRMNVNNNGYFNYNNVDSMANVRPLVADFSKF